MISRIMTVHIWKSKFFIISVSKFNKYLLENCHFHIASYQIDIESYQINMESYLIISYCSFVLILQSHPSLVNTSCFLVNGDKHTS